MSLLVSQLGGAATPTVDGWHGQAPMLIGRAGMVAVLSMACALPPTITAAATPTDWRPSHPDRVARVTAMAPYQATVRTEALEQLSAWFSSYPDQTWRARSSQHPSTRSEAVEQFSIPPLSWRGHYPDRAWALRLSAAAMQSATAFADRDIAVVVPALSWEPYLPDTTSRAQLSTAQYNSTRSEALEQFAVPACSWRGQYPDRTSRSTLTAAAMQPASAFSERDLAVFVPSLAWNGTWPDTTRRSTLSTAQLPYLFRAEAVEQFSVPAMSWQGYQPARVWSFRLQPAQMQAADAYTDLDLAVFVPALAWGPSYPDSTRRAALHPAAIPFTFRAESLESLAPKLLWSAVHPDRTWRLSLSTAQIPAVFRTDVVVIAPTLSWQPTYPPTTRRNALVTAQHPTLFKGEAIEQFAPKLQWNAFYPDTTRRALTLSGGVRATIGWSTWVNPAPPVYAQQTLTGTFVATQGITGTSVTSFDLTGTSVTTSDLTGTVEG